MLWLYMQEHTESPSELKGSLHNLYCTVMAAQPAGAP